MCRLSGRHGLALYFYALIRSTREKCAPQGRFTPISSTQRQECVDACRTDSCARLPPYCSIFIVKYDISCGGQSSKQRSGEYVSVGRLLALPGSVGYSSRLYPHVQGGKRACRGLTSGSNCSRNCGPTACRQARSPPSSAASRATP